jgi:hypothetical protein
MTKSPWSTEQLEGFHQAAQSLKLYRRAELEDPESNASLIRELYVDPLPEEHIFKTVMKPNTTFIIGRKGTGKSTIFQRAQNELRELNNTASAYVDIKTVYESSSVDSATLGRLEALPAAMPKQKLEVLLLYRSFIEATFSAIKDELKARLRESLRARIKNLVSGSIDELFEGLDGLIDEARFDRFISVLGIKQVEATTAKETKETAQSKAGLTAVLGPKPSIEGTIGASQVSELSSAEESSFADVLIRVFNIKEILIHLKKLLTAVSIKHLYIFIDDFSELPEDAMRIVVDTLLAPLNNWSEELIKFKVAAYPGRVYYGQIDKTKIDEIYLDLYSLYGASDVSGMEEKAIDFTRRLVTTRLLYYTKTGPETFFDTVDDDLWRLMFYATMANPRNLGHVLFYLHESSLIYGKLIGRKAIRDAAQRYYEDKIEPYFAMNRFLHETFAERASIYSLKGLLEEIVQRARELKKYRDSTVMKDIKGTPPTSHFYVMPELESLLSTLELNFYLTKYYEMNDRDGHRVSVFALNFGLCQKYAIEYGRPMEKREHRLYFVERIFDYSSLLRKFMQSNQEIRCESCGSTVPLDKLEALKFYGMTCPTCKKGICKVINLSKKYEAILAGISPELLLPYTELGILQTLKIEHRSMNASEIALELDRSYQLVGKRGKMLAQRGLVKRDENEQGRRIFEITELADKSYFSDFENVGLDVPVETSEFPSQ